jgi:hypothetical protein
MVKRVHGAKRLRTVVLDYFSLHIAPTGMRRAGQTILIGDAEGRRRLGAASSRWEDDIKMGLKSKG